MTWAAHFKLSFMLAMIPVALFLQDSLQTDLARILEDPALARASVGVFVKEFAGEALFAQGPDKRLMPASALKLVTASFALDALGAGHPFTTSAWRDGTDVLLLGGADPMLTIEEVLDLGARVGASRSDRVRFDDSVLGPDRVNGTWEFGDMMRADAPPVSGLTVNGGYVDLAISGGKPRLTPRNFGIAIKQGRTSGEPDVRREHGRWTVTVHGNLPDNDPEFATVSLPDPAMCAAKLIGDKAERADLGRAPPDAVQIRKRTLADVLPAMLKRSDNHAAETVLRLAGALKGKSGSWTDSLALESRFLAKTGISPSAHRLADGCGLSRFNEITPRALVQCLEWTLSRETAAVFGSSMCMPGEGTLRNRLQGLDVRAKTGTLAGVCSLVGYIDVGPAKRRLLFAIVFNHYDGPASGVRPIQDAIVRRLVEVTEFLPSRASHPQFR